MKDKTLAILALVCIAIGALAMAVGYAMSRAAMPAKINYTAPAEATAPDAVVVGHGEESK